MNRCGRSMAFFRIGTILALVLGTVLFSGCGKVPEQTTQKQDPPVKKNIDISALKTEEGGYVYAQLDSEEKEIYDALCSTIGGGSLTHTFENVDTEKYKAAMSGALEAVTCEHPEFFWIDGGYSIVTTKTEGASVGKVELTLSCPEYWEKTTKAQKYIDQLKDAVEEIVKEAEKLPGEYRKVLFVHDRIIENTEYYHEAAKNSASAEESIRQSHSAYGSLVNKRAVCDGYAKGFQLVLSRLGIECLYVSGYGSNEPHGWSCVRIDGDYYYIDLTWDDPSYGSGAEGSGESSAVHTYFGLTTQQISRTHAFDCEYTPPECTATRYNYYSFEGLRLDTYDFDSFKATVIKQMGKKIITVAFSEADAYQSAKREILDEKRFSEISVFSSSIRYSTDDDFFILNFYLD